MVQFDFSGLDAASRALFHRDAEGTYTPLNPCGFFLASWTVVPLKVEDPDAEYHLVLTVGDRELSVRPGVRQH